MRIIHILTTSITYFSPYPLGEYVFNTYFCSVNKITTRLHRKSTEIIQTTQHKTMAKKMTKAQATTQTSHIKDYVRRLTLIAKAMESAEMAEINAKNTQDYTLAENMQYSAWCAALSEAEALCRTAQSHIQMYCDIMAK